MIAGHLGLLVIFNATMLVKDVDILPLKHGWYVYTDIPCAKASNSSITHFDGLAFSASKLVNCRLQAVIKLSANSYRVVHSCQDAESHQDDGGPRTTFTEAYSLLSDKEFIATNVYGRFSYRQCPQSELPSPWRSLDMGR